MKLGRITGLWKRKYRLRLIIILLLLTVIFILNRTFSSPAIGTLDKGLATPVPAIDIKKTKSYRGKYISFSAPSFFYLQSIKPSGARSLEVFRFNKKPEPFWQLNIEVLSLSGSLADDPSYKLRGDNPNTYEKSQISAGGKTFVVFSDKTANFSKVAFIDKDGKYASIALFSSDEPDTDNLDQTFNDVLASFTWH